MQESPKLSSKSKILTQEYPSLIERQEEYDIARYVLQRAMMELEAQQQHRTQFIEKVRKTQDDMELAMMSSPNVERPCICNGEHLHTESCMRFAATVARKNENCKLRKKMKTMTRTVDDMLAFSRLKYLRNVQRQKIAEQETDKALTFAPKINPKSRKIYEKMKSSGRDATLAKKASTARSAGKTSVPSLGLN